MENDFIPENSPTLTIDEITSRFSGAIWYSKIQEKTICLAGLGGIGSYVAFILSRIHPNYIHLWDNDRVDNSNMSGQLYSTDNVGHYKVTAVGDMMSKYSGYYSIIEHPYKFTNNIGATDIMICGFDNMEARKTYFNAWLLHVNNLPEEEKGNCLYIDGRLAAEEFQVFCIQGNDNYNIDKYKEKWLFEDSEADETICSYKQTTFMANMIGSVMCNLFVNFVANQCSPLVPRDLPFYTAYNAETMYFKTEA